MINLFCSAAPAQNFDEIGVTLLRAITNLNGAGIRVAQPEAGTPYWEVNPTNLSLPVSLFTYYSAIGSSSSFTNSVGTNSTHAGQVGTNFYSLAYGVATNVAHVDNFEANYFINSVINSGHPSSINDPVVNQSFTAYGATVSEQEEYDSAYDNYAVQFSTLFISSAGNGGTIYPPATCYNGIAVGIYGASSSEGPTPDNGRSKPDITAPGGVIGPDTSYSAPYVSGAAALLMQAALRGDGGSDTTSASDMRTLKALLMNGAVKPVGWTNSASYPLDARYGAGMLNVLNSYEQLVSGKHAYIVSASVATGSPHPPTGATGTESALNGWDFNSISSSMGADGVNHYYFNVTNGLTHTLFAATVTLAWNRPASANSGVHSAINNLGLFLYNAANSNLVNCCTSLVDNVQHLFVTNLPAGRYDLQVWKAGGSGIVSTSESYGLAWAFVAPSLSMAKSGADAILSWPAYPAGFEIVTTTNLAMSGWSANNLPAAVLTGSTNLVQIPMTNDVQFFRLAEPDF